MQDTTHTLVIPGWIYDECLDPMVTEFPRDNPDIAKPTSRRRGRGHQFVYVVNEEQAQTIIEHVLIFGEALSFGADPETMYKARRIVRWVEARNG